MRIFTIVFLFFGWFATAQTADDFVFTIDITTNSTYSFEITSSNTVTIDWGDGSNDSYTGVTNQVISHTYSSTAVYTIIINNQLDSFKFSQLNQDLNITQWGTTSWQTMTEAFIGCDNLVISAIDSPDLSQVTDCSRMFSQSDNFNSDISQWDVSNVVNMSEMFRGAGSFNQDLNNWDVSSVTDMSGMFGNTISFNQPLNNWNVSSVTDMSQMFYFTDSFNQPLDNWNVFNVTNMSDMFFYAVSFNQPIDNWDVSSVTVMKAMFSYANTFNQPLNSWNISSVTDTSKMFSFASSFNQPLNNWDVSSVTNMDRMFSDAWAFNQSLNNWDVSRVILMPRMFFNTISFNQPIDNWDVSNVTLMDFMFRGSNFNQPINNWDVSSVTSMSWMFNGAAAFNQPLDSWDVSNVNNLSFMFSNTASFNQPLDNWNVSNVLDMNNMFGYALSFNQSLGNWDVSNVLNMRGMFDNCSNFNQNLSFWNFNTSGNLDISGEFVGSSGLDSDNYDSLLSRFVNLNLIAPSPNFDASGLEFCDSTSRNLLIQNGWSIINDTPASNCANNTLNGTVLYDINSNGCDPTDLVLDNLPIVISDGTTTYNFFTSNGQYSPNLPDGTYNVVPQFNSAAFSISPINPTITVTNGNSVTQDFCLTATTPVDDLEITILPREEARPGFDTNYKLIYKNKGNTQLSGSINFTYENDYMNFLMATPAVTTSSVGSLNWSFSNLDPFETREIEFSMNLNTPTDPNFPLNSNDILNFNATINPTTGDDTPLDNIFDLQQVVVNSYDPNDKTCLQGETIDPSMVGEFVHYRIRFENEGTASAITVRIVDYIDTTKFDISTLTPLSASHDVTTTITDSNKVEFLFDNINLPFTAPASQGYVLFKIKTVDTLVLGDSFTNQAEIYFDFNFPIITNLDTVTVAVPLSSTDVNSLNVSLYPNPAMDNVTVTSNEAFDNITIYDMNGRVIQTKSFDTAVFNHQLVIDQLTTGLYLLKISNGLQSYNQKLVKQ